MKLEGDWIERTFAKTSGNVTGDRGKIANSWPASPHQRSQKQLREAFRLQFRSCFSRGKWKWYHWMELHFTILLSKVISTSLCNKCVQNFLLLLHKSLFFIHFPANINYLFSLLSSSYDLRGNYILSFSKLNTTIRKILTPFLTFQPGSGMHCQTFSVLAFCRRTLKIKCRCRVLP